MVFRRSGSPKRLSIPIPAIQKGTENATNNLPPFIAFAVQNAMNPNQTASGSSFLRTSR